MLPSCLMLHFAAADMEEGRGNLEAAKQIYEDLAAPLAPDAPESEASEASHKHVPKSKAFVLELRCLISSWLPCKPNQQLTCSRDPNPEPEPGTEQPHHIGIAANICEPNTERPSPCRCCGKSWPLKAA